jgi:PAS domain S-box-containing protein
MGSPTPAELLAEIAALRGRAGGLERHQRELTALLRAHEAITSSLDLEQSLRAIVDQASTIAGGSDTWLYVLDEERKTLRCRVSISMSREEMDGLVMQVGEGIAGRIALNRAPLAISDIRTHPHLWRPDLAAKHRHVSYLGLPIMRGDQVLGVLAFSNPEPRIYAEAEVAFLAVFARQAAITIENARLYEAARRELAERGRAEASLRESEERYRRITAAVSDYIYTVRVEPGGPVETWHGPGCVAVTGYASAEFAADPELWIRMVDEADRDAVRAQARRVQAGEETPPLEHRITRKDGAKRWVRNTPVLHRDAQGRVLSYDGLIRDVTERRLAEDALRSRTAQLEAVRAIGEEITRELDLQALLALIVRRATELIGARAGAILLWDAEAELLVPSAWHGFSDWQNQQRLRLGEGLVGTVAKRRTGMIVNDYRDWPDALRLTLEHSSITAALAEPLLHRDRLLGVIALSDEGTGRVFAKQDQETLALLAAHAVIAIENARLYAAAVRRGSELEALVSAVRSVTSGLELQEIFDRILAEAARMSGAPHVKVLLLDKAAGVLRIGARQGSSMPEGYALPLGVGSSGIVARTGKPLFMADAQHDPRTIFAEQDRDLGIVTYLGLPIKRGEEVLGVLTFNTTQPHRYTADEMAYLASFADQAAVAIENARLFREERERRMQLEAVRTINAEMTRELDLPALLRLFVGRAMELVRAAGCGVWLWDAELHLLAPHAWEGPDWITDVRLRLGEGVIGEAARRGEGVMVNDYVRSPLAHPLWVERTQTRAVIAEPLRYRDRLLGVIAANREGAGEPFRSEDLQALRLLADHAAIAIEKAQLFQELNQSYANLQKAQDDLIRAEKLRALGQMSAGIAHDLNNMLAAILGQVELLRLRARDSEVQEGLRTLETAATDGAHVVRRLQDFARQRGRSPLASIDLAEVVTEALEITRPRWRDEVQRQGRVIEVQVHLADLPPILGYAPEVREVLTNLILNAVDAMPTGGTLCLAAEVMKAVESASQPSLPGVDLPSEVELQVTDTGIGMSEEVRQRIFDPFFTTKGGRGSGLGLSLAYGIMERHGGRIEARSIPGRGTTFTLRFRTAPKKDAAAPQEPTERQLIPRRLLVVDDDPMVRQTIAGLLRASGHLVTEADGGAAGIAQLEETSVDLVFTDLGMPEVTGWDVARAVRARRPGLPIVLLTGWGEHGTGEAQPAGLVDRILGKPVRLEDLLAVVDELTTVEPPEGSRDATPGS